MMKFSAFAPLSALLGQLSAATSIGHGKSLNTDGFSKRIIGTSTGGGSACISGNTLVPISVTGNNIFYTPSQDQARLTESFVEMNQVDSTFVLGSTSGGVSIISGSYSIFCKFCLPSDHCQASKVQTVQLLTHSAMSSASRLFVIWCLLAFLRH